MLGKFAEIMGRVDTWTYDLTQASSDPVAFHRTSTLTRFSGHQFAFEVFAQNARDICQRNGSREGDQLVWHGVEHLRNGAEDFVTFIAGRQSPFGNEAKENAAAERATAEMTEGLGMLERAETLQQNAGYRIPWR